MIFKSMLSAQNAINCVIMIHVSFLIMFIMLMESQCPRNVKIPQVYILGRSRADEAEQLSYAETRIDDLKAFTRNPSLTNGIEIEDAIPFFHGHGPA